MGKQSKSDFAKERKHWEDCLCASTGLVVHAFYPHWYGHGLYTCIKLLRRDRLPAHYCVEVRLSDPLRSCYTQLPEHVLSQYVQLVHDAVADAYLTVRLTTEKAEKLFPLPSPTQCEKASTTTGSCVGSITE